MWTQFSHAFKDVPKVIQVIENQPIYFSSLVVPIFEPEKNQYLKIIRHLGVAEVFTKNFYKNWFSANFADKKNSNTLFHDLKLSLCVDGQQSTATVPACLVFHFK